ncbi:MAG: hypothetical protein JSU90_08625 [Nitrospiraceae bacterium]|nr:MAG: hypothetical protein JSU90_08625 [Nitrospiraceae bacterium]
MAKLKKIDSLWQAALRGTMALVLIGIFSAPVHSGVPGEKLLERIVAIVNNEVILLSEFQEQLHAAAQSGSGAAPGQVLDELVNRMLILQEGRRFRIIDPGRYDLSEEEMKAAIEEYIDRRIKAFIHIPFRDIEQYYRMNRDQFPERDLYEARDGIEEILISRELEARISIHMKDLRNRAYVRIQLEDDRR